jgi:flagellar assembly protein FliH
VADAKKIASSIEQSAYEKGFAQGEKDGRAMGAKKIDKILEDIQGILEKVMAHKDEFAKAHEKAILDLIGRIVQRVVYGRAEVDNTIVRETIFRTFALAADRSEMTVKVSPVDLEHIKDLRPTFFERIKELKSMTIESDPTIAPGGCVLETAFGHVDGRLESQLEKITESVKEVYSQQNGQA